MTNYMFRFVYGTRYTKIRIKYNVLNVRKIAISGSYLVPNVPDIAFLLYTHHILCLKLAVDKFLVHHCIF